MRILQLFLLKDKQFNILLFSKNSIKISNKQKSELMVVFFLILPKPKHYSLKFGFLKIVFQESRLNQIFIKFSNSKSTVIIICYSQNEVDMAKKQTFLHLASQKVFPQKYFQNKK